MSVTPEQIEGASFSTVKRGGYRTEEVDRFLRTVADEYRALASRVRSAEGANEDLNAASQEMATLMRDVHAQLGEKRRLAEIEHEELRQAAETEAAAVISRATEQADGVRAQADRVLSDAEHHAELLRSDGEQRVREQAQATLSAARGELQELLRRKHEVLHALSSLKSDLTAMEQNLEATALSPESLDDGIINQTLIDLREAQAAAAPPAAAPPAATPATAPPTAADQTVAPPPPPPAAPAAPESLVDPAPPAADPAAPVPPPPPPAAPEDSSAAHPAGTGTFFSPPDEGRS